MKHYKYITAVVIGLILGLLGPIFVVNADAAQLKNEPEPPKGEELVFPPDNYVPKTLDSRVIATPRYPMSEPVPKLITMVEHYFYDESKYSPPLILSRIPEGLSDTSSPERAMLSRTAALINGDYDLYLSYWDEESRLITEKEFKHQKITRESMVGNWVGTLRQVDMVMLRRIDVSGYVVLLYDFQQKTGKREKLGLKFPVTFKKTDRSWLASQALREDDLLGAAPWTSGQDVMEKTVR